MQRLLLLLITISTFAACTKSEVGDPSNVSGNLPESITVSFEDSDDTRIELNSSLKTVWNAGDEVSLFYRSYKNMKWAFQGNDGDRSGEIKHIEGESGEQTMDKSIIVYPYNANYRIDLEDGYVEASLPTTQYYKRDSYGENGNIMVAKSSFTQFVLRSVVGWLRFELSGNGKTVKSIKVRGNKEEQVAGLVYINASDASMTLASGSGLSNGEGEVGGNINFNGSIATEVTLDCGDGVALNSETTAFYIALPPQEYKSGISIDVIYSDSSTLSHSVNYFTIERNHIVPIALIEEVKGESWGVVGSFCNWNSPDIKMTYLSSKNMHVAYGVELKAYEQFKVRLNEDWTENFGATNGNEQLVVNESSALKSYGPNFIVPRDGIYDIYIDWDKMCLWFMASGTAPWDEPSSDDTSYDNIYEQWYHKDLATVFDMEALPEIHVNVTLDEWNRLLSLYDRNPGTAEYIHCDVEYSSKGETYNFEDAAIRLRGNTSRRRPEGNSGEMHKTNNTDWHHCHFMINLRKYQKDDAHELHNLRKFHLKWFKDDSNYCRELYCYDLMRRFGIWTACYSSYCRLWIHVEGDSKPAYYGVYSMLEPIDDKFVKRREDLFDGKNGNLWKCRYGATLNYNDINGAWMGYDDDSGNDYVYEFKGEEEDFDAARSQLIEFSRNITQLQGDEFRTWIESVCDVEFLMRTYAASVAVGMWDDYWNNCNNFYMYFNTTDNSNYKFFFLPYDYDNTLGTSLQCGVQSDSGRQSPLKWGDTSKNPLIGKLLEIDDFREMYIKALKVICNKNNDLLYYSSSISRIEKWHRLISNYVENDTDEDCVIKDRPASWGNHYEYRLLNTDSSVNFFRVKAASIEQL
ncbi:MAG: CotH kinase family protein [Alistipes sp.]|nr:CotH kinase family protein [Alistipes sp.]